MTTLFISHSRKDKEWAKRVHKALSDSDYHCLFLDSHPDDGIHVGANWEQTLYQTLRQSRGVVVLCSANWLGSPWCVAEAIMARERKSRVFLLARPNVIDGRQVKGLGGRELPDFLKDGQFISLADLTEEEANRQLLQGLEKEGLDKRDFTLPDRPYPGLEPFQEADAAVFFGRVEEVDQVIYLLHRSLKGNAKGFVVVLGASGCGKSSLVRAGVLPHLKRASKGDPHPWVVVAPFMAGKGLGGLALSLAQSFKDAGRPSEFGVLRDCLASTEDLITLGRELLLAHSAPEGRVLVILDQLEEVFGTPEESEARTVLRRLLAASADPVGSVVVLATMRSDFLNAFQLFEGAAKHYEEVTLDPMDRSHFSEVIEGPAGSFGIDISAGLSGRMVEDTAYSDALPLLAFTLEQLYKKCGPQGPLTLKAYDELGGVSTAIKHAADAILKREGYADLPADDWRMRDLRRAFYSLAQVGEDGQFTKRTARWSQMPASCEEVLKHFVAERLLVAGIDNDEPVLSIAHEALFRVWDELQGWLKDGSPALAKLESVKRSAQAWKEARDKEPDAKRKLKIDHELLWSASRLGEVQHMLSQLGLEQKELPSDMIEFLRPEQDRLVDELKLPIEHSRRAWIGDRLAELNDPRRGVGVRAGKPEICWCKVPGGHVEISRDQPVMFDVKPFNIAKYVVTLAQFNAFALSESYYDDKWWADLPIEPSERSPVQQWPHVLNRPAEFVSWYQAVAYCRWLSHTLGYTVRLPTEWEWQQAATAGHPYFVYPWGIDWNPNHANTKDSGAGHLVSVGLYPEGASPVGALDMSGNLYEWCQNQYDGPERVSLGHEPRVTRGGAYFVIGKTEARESVKVTARLRDNGNGYNDQGNRIRAGIRLACDQNMVRSQSAEE